LLTRERKQEVRRVAQSSRAFKQNEKDKAKMSERDRVKALMAKKDEIEKEIQTLTQQLNQPGGAGLTGNLIDKDGFPIEDVNLVLSSREARHRIACLRTDHTNIMKQIEEGLQKVFQT